MRSLFLALILLTGAGWLSAQGLSDWTPTTTNAPASPPPKGGGTALNAATAPPKVSPATQPAAAATTDSGDSASMPASDFLIDGVPYAKVLYLEGNVWIRPPDDTSFHLLADDEPIPLHSVITTGITGILDFATGPGMAVRMVPQTVLTVTTLPEAGSLSTSTSGAPEATEMGLKRGTIFSALGRSDNQPIDFKVRTPQGVAGARGTMFATSVTDGQSEVSMLHGTVNFQTPDNQSSQITAGQSQQISAANGGKFHFGQSRTLNPAKSSEFFNHAGGLLEHASGYGVVRRGLGPDVARTLHERGYALPAETQRRFQNAARVPYKHRPAFHRAQKSPAAGSGEKGGAAAKANDHPLTGPADRRATTPGERLNPTERKENERDREPLQRRYPGRGEDQTDRNNKDLNQ